MVPTKMPLSTFSEGRGNALKYFACLLHNWFRFHQHERLHAYGTMDLSSIVRTASSPWTRSMACVQYHGLWLLMMRTPFCQCLRICQVLVTGTRKRVNGSACIWYHVSQFRVTKSPFRLDQCLWSTYRVYVCRNTQGMGWVGYPSD